MVSRSLHVVAALSLGLLAAGCGGGGGGGGTGAGAGAGANQAPIASNDAFTTSVNLAVTLNVLANDADPDGDVVSVQSFTQGTSGGTVAPGPAGTLIYTPPAAFVGVDTFKYTATDGKGGTDDADVTVTVGNANTPPSLSAPFGGMSVGEDVVTAVPGGVVVTDTEASANGGDVLVSLSASNGTMTLASVVGLSFQVGDGTRDKSLLFTGTLSDVNNALSAPGFNYLNDPDFDGSDSIFVFVDDRGNSGSGGVLSDSGSIPVSVVGVNDGPTVVVPAPQSVDEDTNLFLSGVVVDDPDAGLGNLLVDLQVAIGTLSLATTSGLSFNVGDGFEDTAMQFTGTLTQIDAALSPLRYRSQLHKNSDVDGLETLQIDVSDQGNTGSPFTVLTTSESLTITVNAVNDPPLIALPPTPTTTEDSPVVIGGISVSDPDIASSATLSVSIDAQFGTITLGSLVGLNFTLGDGIDDPGVAFVGTQANVNAALNNLTYEPNLDFNGFDTLSFTTNDGGAFGSGGPRGDAKDLFVNVQAVNDAPVITPPAGPLVVDEDLVLGITGTSILDVDVDNASLEFTAAVTQGTLTLGTVAGLTFSVGDGTQDASMTASGTLVAVNNALALIQYQGNADYNGPDGLTLQVDDLGNTGLGGPQQDSTVTAITVNPVNDGPFLTGILGNQTVAEDTPLSLNPPAVVDDIDLAETGGAELLVTLSVSNGTLDLFSTAGLTFTVGDGTDDPSMTFTGAIADVNTALSPLTYQGLLNFNGDDTVVMLFDDQGFTGSPGPLSTGSSIPVTVTSVNDAPVTTDVASLTPEDISTSISLLATDVDFDVLTYEIVTPPTNGALSNLDPLAGTVDYLGDLHFFGADSFTFRVSDGTVFSNTSTVNVTVTPVNDALWASLDVGLTIKNLGVTVDVLANDEDVDGDPLSVTAVTQGQNGAVVVNVDDTVTYTPNTGFDGFDQFTYTAADGNGQTFRGSVVIKVDPFDLSGGNERVSVDSGGGEGGNGSTFPGMSRDGRFVVFATDNDFDTNDTNTARDVYLHDRFLGTTTLVSHTAGGTAGSGASRQPTISEDGRYVAYETDADDIVSGDTNGLRDIIRWDRVLDDSVRVSVTTTGGQALGGGSFEAHLSADGSRVVFESEATNLLDGSPFTDPGIRHVYVRDFTQAPADTLLLSRVGGTPAADGDSSQPRISGDGLSVAYTSASSSLGPPDTNGTLDVYLHTIASGSNQLVSVDSLGNQGNGSSSEPDIGQDGSVVVFSSSATNLIAGDANGATSDIFVRELNTPATRVLSRNSAGTQANGASGLASVSQDGRYVAFVSFATNLDLFQPDTGNIDGFVHDRQTGRTERVTLDTAGGETNGNSFRNDISGDGNHVAFETSASDMVAADGNFAQDVVVVRTEVPQTPLRVSVDSSGAEADSFSDDPAPSYDGRFTVFDSPATNLVASDGNAVRDVFRRDRISGQTIRVSVAGGGTEGDSFSFDGDISYTGDLVVFVSDATNFGGDTNAEQDIFHRRISGNQTVRANVSTGGGQADDLSDEPTISGDGRWVAFRSFSDTLVTTDANGFSDVFVRDVVESTTTRVSIRTRGAEGDGDVFSPRISDDGRYVVFASAATTLVETDVNGFRDVFLHDRLYGVTELVSVDDAGIQANAACFGPDVSADGRWVVFSSAATNLVAGDGNGLEDVFMHDRQTDTTTRISEAFGGGDPDGVSGSPRISADGEYVAFRSTASNLLSTSEAALDLDVFVWERTGGTIRRISETVDGSEPNGPSQAPDISADGRYVGFESDAANLAQQDANLSKDAFLRRNLFSP